MYITNVAIKGLKWIDCIAGIRSIDIQAISQIQIVIGTNGSGKSKLLEQITPLPANKNDYNLGGYKELIILHEGDEYKIASNFEKKQGTHSFIKNGGANLNVNGLTTTQVELCKQHLGYTPLIDDLLHCRYNFCTMSVAERKQLLLSMSPSVPDFIIQLHRQAKSELRSCKSNLQLLYTRKQAVEEKLYAAEVLSVMYTESTTLEQQQISLSNEIYLLQNQIKEYSTECSQMVHEEVPIEKAVRYRRKVQQVLHTAPIKIATVDMDKTISELMSMIGQTEDQMTGAVDNYQKVIAELQQYDPSVFEDKDDEQQNCLKFITEKMQRLETIKHHFGFDKIPESRIARHQEVFNILYDKFTGENAYQFSHWYAGSVYNRVKNKHYAINNNLQALVDRRSMIDRQVFQIEEQLKQLLQGPQEILPNCNKCDYAKHYDAERGKLQAAEKENKQVLKALDKRIDKFSRVELKLRDLSTELKRQMDILQEILSYLSGTVWQYTEKDLLTTLNGDVNQWLHHCKQTIQAQQFLVEKAELEKDIQQAQFTINALKVTQTPAMEILKKLYKEKQLQMNEYQQRAFSLRKKKEDLTVKLQYCEKYKKLKEAGERLLVDLENHHQFVMLDEYVKYLRDSILVHLMTEKQTLDEKIFKLTAELKEQETLKARYTEEITSLIEKIEKKQSVYQYLEIGLNPESGMPHYNTLQFINAILENVNFILEKLWTYPIQMELLKEDDDVSCDFMVKCNNKQPGQISRMSKSQQAAINFAFYVALVYAANGNDYPIFFDECDDGFDKRHKQTFLEWLKLYMDSQYAPQLWMIYHDPMLYSGFLYKDIICLKEDNIQLPQEINLYTKMNTL